MVFMRKTNTKLSIIIITNLINLVDESLLEYVININNVVTAVRVLSFIDRGSRYKL